MLGATARTVLAATPGQPQPGSNGGDGENSVTRALRVGKGRRRLNRQRGEVEDLRGEVDRLRRAMAPQLLRTEVHELVEEVKRQQEALSSLKRAVREDLMARMQANSIVNAGAEPSQTIDVEANSGASPLPSEASREAMREWLDAQKLPQRIILVRHAESRGNLDEATYTNTPDWKVPLSEEGEQQAKRAGLAIRDMLEASHGDSYQLAVYCSPYERCVQTCNGILEAVPEDKIFSMRQEVQLREQDFGNFQVLEDTKRDKADRLRYGRFFYRFPKGESGADVFNRMSMMEDELVRDIRAGRYDQTTSVLIVSHGLSLRVMLMNWLNWTVDELNSVWNPLNATPLVLERIVAPEELEGIINTEDGRLSSNLSWIQVKAMYRLSRASVEILQGVTESMSVITLKAKMLSTLDEE